MARVNRSALSMAAVFLAIVIINAQAIPKAADAGDYSGVGQVSVSPWTAAKIIYAATEIIFADGFERGDTSNWSASVGEVEACAHSYCEFGVALDSGCDPCVTQICAVDSFCCTTQWDSACIAMVSSVCGLNCP